MTIPENYLQHPVNFQQWERILGKECFLKIGKNLINQVLNIGSCQEPILVLVVDCFQNLRGEVEFGCLNVMTGSIGPINIRRVSFITSLTRKSIRSTFAVQNAGTSRPKENQCLHSPSWLPSGC